MTAETVRLRRYLEQTGMTFVRRIQGDGLMESYRGYPLTQLCAAHPIPAMLDTEKALALLREWDAWIDAERLREMDGKEAVHGTHQ